MGRKPSLSASPPFASALILRVQGYQPPQLMPGTAQFCLWVQQPTQPQMTRSLPLSQYVSGASSSVLRPDDSTAEGSQEKQKPISESKKDTKKNGGHTIPVQMI